MYDMISPLIYIHFVVRIAEPLRPLRYESVCLPLRKVADTPFHI